MTFPYPARYFTLVVCAKQNSAGCEPFSVWEGLDPKSDEYQRLKEERAKVLMDAVEVTAILSCGGFFLVLVPLYRLEPHNCRTISTQVAQILATLTSVKRQSESSYDDGWVCSRTASSGLPRWGGGESDLLKVSVDFFHISGC